jgi:hypothetical protein
MATDPVETRQIILLGMSDAHDDEEGCTPVVPRRKKRERKVACKVMMSGSLAK